jgi:hypothetical protein
MKGLFLNQFPLTNKIYQQIGRWILQKLKDWNKKRKNLTYELLVLEI